MKTSLAISTYFREGYNPIRLDVFKRSLTSLFETSYDGKIIVVDDGSGAKHHLEWVRRENPNVLVVEKSDNGGISTTKNTCLKYILQHSNVGFLCDDDVLYAEGFDAAYVETMQLTGIQHLSAFIAKSPPRVKKKIKAGFVDKTSLLNGLFLTVTRDMIKKIGYFPKMPYKYGHEHVNFTMRCIRNGFAPFFCDVVDSSRFISIIHESGQCPSVGYDVHAQEHIYKLNANAKIAFNDLSYREIVE